MTSLSYWRSLSRVRLTRTGTFVAIALLEELDGREPPMATCGTCNGKGRCPKCDGHGKTGAIFSNECSTCRGKKVCPTCKGSGRK